ncbi:hypothetical protein [Frigoriglobus tundricola]|uniref:HEAT repeat domain-containing protein n=1 Tax=Frigoriglobus tundricola TaxID=2774151 RepID=A0A6M5YHZ2_9BACT|nr:hypothetical protein [Frigoriglobus tundricola]QJW93665.1 hypothetical protein FTUN_1173 [Frigoriglobus tundricola]
MSITPTRRAALVGLLAAGLARPGRAAPVPVEVAGKELETLWADLAGEELTASRALLKLAARPKEAVALAAKRLPPLKIDAPRMRGLLADLGSEKEETWTAATEELEYFDPRLAIDLPALMDAVTERVPRARLVALLSGDRSADRLLKSDLPITLSRNGGKNGQEEFFNFRQEESWWAEHRVDGINVGIWGNRRKYWTRAVRAAVLLEHIGSPEAVAVLRNLATGHPDAQPTKVAKEVLARMEKAK